MFQIEGMAMGDSGGPALAMSLQRIMSKYNVGPTAELPNSTEGAGSWER